MSNPLYNALDEISNTLKFMRSLGMEGVECSKETLSTIKNLDSPLKTDNADLPALEKEILGCSRCGLSRNRSLIVFGEGNPQADLIFVGEAPGEEEDRQGKPFVGAAGQLLTKIIAAMKLSREDIYICNIIKCRPPSNRDPLPEEIESCLPFLRRQIDFIKPKVICALGGFAAQTLLDDDRGISRLRGKFQSYQGVKVMPTFHPAYLLRYPEKKREVWEDIKKVMAELEITP